MNSYEMKQQARRERLERAAEKLREESESKLNAGREYFYQMNGQPILVGHHSEKRHRNQIAKAEAKIRKGLDLDKEARELARRADAVGTGGISSDDPDAIAKLDDKRTDLERQRDRMKQVNTLWRKRDAAGLAALGYDLAKLDAQVAEAYSWEKQPFPKWQIANLSARIRDAAKRAETITETAALPASTETVGLATITVDPDDNRVSITFPSRLTKADYQKVRAAGFVWSPSRGAFVRKLSSGAVYWAKHVAGQITALEDATR